MKELEACEATRRVVLLVVTDAWEEATDTQNSDKTGSKREFV